MPSSDGSLSSFNPEVKKGCHDRDLSPCGLYGWALLLTDGVMIRIHRTLHALLLVDGDQLAGYLSELISNLLLWDAAIQ